MQWKKAPDKALLSGGRRNETTGGPQLLLYLLMGGGTVWLMRPGQQQPGSHVVQKDTDTGTGQVIKRYSPWQTARRSYWTTRPTGTIAATGGVTIIKADSGAIAYRGTGNNPQYHDTVHPAGGQFFNSHCRMARRFG